MKQTTVVSANIAVLNEIENAERTVKCVRKAYRGAGFVTHIDIRDVACGQLFREYIITAIKEDEDE